MIHIFGQLTAVAALVLGLAISPVAHADQEDTVTESFRVDPGGTVIVDTDIGGIRVKPGSSRDVTVTIRQHFRTDNRNEIEDLRDRLHIDLDQRGNDVLVTVELDKPVRRFLGISTDGNLLRLQFEITVPATFNADLSTSDDDIIVENLTGTVDCRTSDGDIRVGDITGPVTIKTSDGDIVVNRVTGPTELNTSDGDIKAGDLGGDVDATTSDGDIIIEHADGFARLKTSDGDIQLSDMNGAIDAKTSDGDIIAAFSSQPDRDSRLITSDGDIAMEVHQSCRLSLDAQSSDGSIRAEGLTMSMSRQDRHHLVAELNGGGPELYLRTSDGDIIIEER